MAQRFNSASYASTIAYQCGRIEEICNVFRRHTDEPLIKHELINAIEAYRDAINRAIDGIKQATFEEDGHIDEELIQQSRAEVIADIEFRQGFERDV